VNCCHCEGIEQQFDPATADRELRRFRRKGARSTTKMLIGDLRAAGVNGLSLLDIGGGIGAIHHELLDAGATTAVHVDVSPAYIAAAESEAVRRGHADRVRFVHGDFVEVATTLPDADVVTLDRVICCYPDMPLLVGRAAEKARRVFAAVYPRDVWWMRAGAALANRFLRLKRSAFRVYIHSPTAVGAELARRGFERFDLRRTIAWEVVAWRATGRAQH
jgi:magnesium-protoporphyrin O-methyltransferase